MRNLIALFSFMLVFCQTGKAQLKFTSGVDIGFTATQPPFYKKKLYFNGQYTNYNYPLPGLILGYQLETAISKHFILNSSIQYTVVGTRYRKNGEGQSFSENGLIDFTSRSIEKQTFHRISAPLTAGFRFRLGDNVKQTLALGFKFNFYLAGSDYKSYQIDSKDNSRDHISVYKIDPLAPKNSEPIKRFNNQIMLRYTTTVKDQYMFGLDFNVGLIMYYAEYSYWESPYGQYHNADAAFTFTYLFK